MCGITGVLGSPVPDREQVEKAARLQDHRGPDFFNSAAGEGYCFCHNRLSVIDLSSRSNQPVEDKNGILVFNGEIYNFKSLSASLPGAPSSSSDTLTLFSLLEHEGPAIIPQLNGMFAFAWYDKRQRTLLLARDRTGIKPLYYASYGNRFFFSSEIKTLLALLETTAVYSRADDLDPEYIADIVAFGHGQQLRTPFRVIRELPPGTTLTVRSADLSTEAATWFSIPDTISLATASFPRQGTDAAPVARLDTLLNDSVKLHLIADAPIGILCSGGIDSSLITAIAAKNGANVSIYHATVKDGPGELAYAKMVADRYKLDLHTVYIDAPVWLESLADAVYHLDAPIYHPSDISLYTVSRLAHEHGVKALLCGEGADELFGGYGWHSLFAATWKRHAQTSRLSRLIDTAYRAFKRFRFSDYFTREELLYYTDAYLPYSNSNVPLFAKRGALLRGAAGKPSTDSLLAAYTGRDGFPELAAFITSNLYGHLSTLLQRNDRMCMKASIESRVPFLENGLIDFALRLDTSWKLRGRTGKYILKKCAETYLPKPVIYRKKAGFPVPWQSYTKQIPDTLFRNGFMSEYFHMSENALLQWAKPDVDLLYTAVALEVWGRIVVGGQSVEQVKHLLRR
ncbi:MAG: asparagine synthase (glutamine-hydrolyzing) [Chitinispirillaceae bacterium]|nr:asparagine synthase (glutamine-hydrolyzing) [Chitinispirillaceae bacterium]